MDISCLEDLIKFACKAPQMISINGNFGEVASYINGFSAGSGGEIYAEYMKFQLWIGLYFYKKYGMPRNYVWSYYISHSDIMINNSEFSTLLFYFEMFKGQVEGSEIKVD